MLLKDQDLSRLVAGKSVPLNRLERRQAQFHDFTRWALHLGRDRLLDLLPPDFRPERILEVGSTTAYNLIRLRRRFPQADITGVEQDHRLYTLARENLGTLRHRIKLRHRAYLKPLDIRPRFDLIVCSYSLGQMSADWELALKAARHDLAPGGLIAVLDYEGTDSHTFGELMAGAGVQLDNPVLPCLEQHFEALTIEQCHAYGQLWRYFTFIGRGKLPQFPSVRRAKQTRMLANLA